MPLGRLQVTYLLELLGRHPARGGRALCLGVPDRCIALDYEWIRETAARTGAAIALPNTAGEITDYRAFFRAAGFSGAASLDISDFEGAEHLLDLNQADTPEDLVGKFELIMNHGTLEHVFHLPHALAHVTRMLEVGGTVLHLLPVNNFVDHGYYQFSPRLFWDYYQANRFDLLESVFTHRDAPLAVPEQIGARPFDPYVYRPDEWVGKLGPGWWTLILAARKGPHAQEGIIPQQGTYPWAARRA